MQKNLYGDAKSSGRGRDAKANAFADGDMFDLVEHSMYNGNSNERGKTSQAHRDVTDWDYFVKTVAIDGTYFDELINVRRKPSGEYVYEVNLWENEEKKDQVPHIAQGIYKKNLKALTSEATSSFDDSISPSATKGNTQDGKLSVSPEEDQTYMDAVNVLISPFFTGAFNLTFSISPNIYHIL